MLIIDKKQTITPESESVLLSREEFDEIQKKEADRESKINNLEINVLFFKHELDKLKRSIYGQKSERFISNIQPEEQLTLPFAIEIRPVELPNEETLTYSRKKRKNEKPEGHGRQILPAHLPRKVIVIEPDIDLTNAIKIGEKVTEVLGYIPGELYVEQIVRPQYKLPQDGKIVIAELPPLPIPKGNAGASLLAYIIVSKYVHHLPFYRIAQILNRDSGDYKITESTLIDWFNAACRLLEPLYGDMKKLVLTYYYLMADESPIKVLTKDKPGATHKGYFWAYYAPRENIAFFEYQKGRGREGPKEFLKDFRGSLQTDGYTAYDYFEQKEGITLLACMAHARRKFEESLDNDPALADWMMTKIQELYEIEDQARKQSLSFDERKELRQLESVPILSEMEKWMRENQLKTLPASSIGKAINYTLNLWKRLIRYVDDGRVEIDNNLIENSIRPIALGRKNYLFAGSHEAAQRAAMIYSFMGTCKKNGIEPLEWLTDVLSRINECKINQLAHLLPIRKPEPQLPAKQD
jgi:transposase